MTIAVVCSWLKLRTGGEISETEILTGCFSEALSRAINDLIADSNDANIRKKLIEIDKEVISYDGKSCSEIGNDLCIKLFEEYNKIYKIEKGG